MVVGCTVTFGKTKTQETLEPVPTVHNVFGVSDDGNTSENSDSTAGSDSLASSTDSTEDSLPVISMTKTIRPTLPPLPTLTPRPTIQKRIITVYGDMLNENWSLENSRQVEYELENTSYSYSGTNSLAFKPKAEYGDLFFTLNESSNETYLRDDVLAVRFWLYGDEDIIETDDFAVSVVGSNDFPYWVEGDNSVMVQDSGPVFPETRLHFLNIENDIPSNTWVLVEVWLNDLIYEPQYEYVTGFLLKNDQDYFFSTYIDEVEILLREN